MFNQKTKSYKAFNIFKQMPNNKTLKQEITHSIKLCLSNTWISYIQKRYNGAATGTLRYSALLQKHRKELGVLGVMLTIYFLQAMYLSATFSQLITFQIAFR